MMWAKTNDVGGSNFKKKFWQYLRGLQPGPPHIVSFSIVSFIIVTLAVPEGAPTRTPPHIVSFTIISFIIMTLAV